MFEGPAAAEKNVLEEMGRSKDCAWNELMSGECVSTLNRGGAKTSCCTTGLVPGRPKLALADVCLAFDEALLAGSGRCKELPDVVDTALVLPAGYG